MAVRLQPWLLIIVCWSVFPASGVADTGGLLDGMTFVGLNGEKGQSLDPDEKEEMVFQNGRFRSVSCEPYNFSSSPYSAVAVGTAIHFKAVTESPTHGQISWQGVVEGDTAEVTFVWTKQRWYWDTRREYWFRGSRKR